MKQARRTAFLLVLLPFMSVRLALGQGDDGFLRGQGNLDVAPSYSVDTYNAFWAGRESVESPDVGRVTRTTYNLYTAYGLTYAVGDGQTDYRLQGVVQYRLETFFAALETGYDVRTGLPHDEIPLHLTAGFNFDPYLISAFFSTVDSLGGYDIGEGAFPGVEEDYQRLGLKAYLRLTDRFGLSASGFTTLDGPNTGDVDNGAVGLVARF